MKTSYEKILDLVFYGLCYEIGLFFLKRIVDNPKDYPHFYELLAEFQIEDIINKSPPK